MNLTKLLVESAVKSGATHIPSALSILDIAHVMYRSVLTNDDVFCLSKGHGALALYTVLAALGRMPLDELECVGAFDSPYGGHPNCLAHKDIWASTGSLGHGLPMAVGAAMAKKILKEPGVVYCLVGDQELEEGTTWESINFAVDNFLDNLVVMVDDNGSRHRYKLHPRNIAETLLHLGCMTHSADGHSPDQIKRAVDWHATGFTRVAIYKTVKGKGVPFMEKDPAMWHSRKVRAVDIEGLFA